MVVCNTKFDLIQKMHAYMFFARTGVKVLYLIFDIRLSLYTYTYSRYIFLNLGTTFLHARLFQHNIRMYILYLVLNIMFIFGF